LTATTPVANYANWRGDMPQGPAPAFTVIVFRLTTRLLGEGIERQQRHASTVPPSKKATELP
jgi:hypothetical protein